MSLGIIVEIWRFEEHGEGAWPWENGEMRKKSNDFQSLVDVGITFHEK